MMTFSTVRRLLGLPSVDVQTDAQYGFDGGRHCHVLKRLHKCQVGARQWLMVDSLLRTFSLRVRVAGGSKVVAYLDLVKLKGGGMV